MNIQEEKQIEQDMLEDSYANNRSMTVNQLNQEFMSSSNSNGNGSQGQSHSIMNNTNNNTANKPMKLFELNGNGNNSISVGSYNNAPMEY